MTNYTHPEVRFAEESGDADTVDNEDAADIVTKPRVDAVNADADTLDGHDTPLPTTAIGALSGSPVPSSDLDLSDLVTAIAGDNVTADTTNAELDTSGGSANVPGWEEDANSPKSVSGSTSLSYTLASDYKYVKVFRDTSNYGMALDLTVNGDTGSNYDSIDESGTTTAGSSAWPLTFAGDTPAFMLVADRSTQAGAIMLKAFTAANSNETQSGENGNTKPPIDSFTMTDAFDNARDEKIHVYGWNP